jgi:hypothetical protein
MTGVQLFPPPPFSHHTEHLHFLFFIFFYMLYGTFVELVITNSDE